MPRRVHRRCPPRFWLDLQPRPERVLGICKRLYAKQARSLSGWFRVSSGGRSCFNLVQPHSASSAWVVWLETWLGRAPWPAQSAACGPENPSRKLPGCHPSFLVDGRRGPTPRVAARDDLSRFVRAVMLVLEFGAREEPAGCVQRMISFRERRSGLPGQRHGCVGLGLC